MRPERRDQPSLVPGERVLAQLKPIGGGKYEGRTLRRLTDAPGRLLGVYQPRTGGTGRIEPIDRRVKAEWRVPAGEDGGAEAGEIVVATPLPAWRRRAEAGPHRRTARAAWATPARSA